MLKPLNIKNQKKKNLKLNLLSKYPQLLKNKQIMNWMKKTDNYKKLSCNPNSALWKKIKNTIKIFLILKLPKPMPQKIKRLNNKNNNNSNNSKLKNKNSKKLKNLSKKNLSLFPQLKKNPNNKKNKKKKNLSTLLPLYLLLKPTEPYLLS